MTVANHMATGALISLSVTNPASAIILSFLSHFVLDILPHFGLQTEKNIVNRNQNLLFRFYVILGIILAVVIIPVLLSWLSGAVSLWLLCACLLAAVLPDLIMIPHYIAETRHKRELPKSWFSRFHSGIQKLDYPWGAIVELIWLLAMLYLISLQL